jgi:predicted PurR-regulated permease PerM
MPRQVSSPKNSRFVVLASVCVVVAALYFAQTVLIPLALAMLLSFLLAPVVNRVERLHIGRVPSVMIVVVIVFVLIGALGYVVWTQVYDLADHIDQYSGNIIAKVEQLRPGNGGVFSKVRKTVEEVQQKVDQPQSATTQTTQPGDKAHELIASEIAARTGTPRMRSETAPQESATTLPAVASTQWTRQNPLPVGIVQPSSPLQTLGTYLGVVAGPLGTAGIVAVFMIFMLLQREDLRNRLIRLTGRGQLTIATTALDDATTRISRYLTAQAIVNGSYGAAIAIGLWIIGLTIGRHDPSQTSHFPNVILWGMLCAILRFIPYLGPWIAAAFPVFIALAVYKSFGVFVSVVLLFVVIELGSNNLMEPWLYGSSTGMSTVAILVSAVFWTWLWGVIGLLLATPLTVVLVVLGKYVPQLSFLDVMLGDEPAFEPPARVYQRLLALDAEESLDVVEEFRDQMSLEQVYDTILLPAMALAEQDRHKGLLDERRQTFIRETMRDIIEEMGDQEPARCAKEQEDKDQQEGRSEPEVSLRGSGTDSTPSGAANADEEISISASSRLPIPRDSVVNVVCLPAHDEADEICNLMLAQLLEFRGYRAHSISHNALASEMVEQIESKDADVTIVSALPPAAVAHARYLCKRVHARYPEAPMAVGLWTLSRNVERARERITCVHSVQLGTTLKEMQAIVDELAQRAIVTSNQ